MGYWVFRRKKEKAWKERSSVNILSSSENWRASSGVWPANTNPCTWAPKSEPCRQFHFTSIHGFPSRRLSRRRRQDARPSRLQGSDQFLIHFSRSSSTVYFLIDFFAGFPRMQEVPKALLPVANRPVISYVLELLELSNLKDLIVVSSFHFMSSNQFCCCSAPFVSC